MPKNSKKYIFFISIVAVAIFLFLYYDYHHKPQKAIAFTPPAVMVDLTHVIAEKWPRVLQGTGTVTAQNGVLIRAQVSGQILQQFFHSSASVKAGAAIYQIDPQGLVQLIKQNEAQATLRAAQLKEQQALYAKGFVSKNEYDTAVANYKVAVNTLRQNKHKLSLTLVTAPFSGQLGVMLVHQGDFVKDNDPLVSLQNSDDLRVDFTLPGNFSNLAKVGQSVEVEVLQYPDKIFKGKVMSVNASINEASQSILVRAQLDPASRIITPGSFANVQLYINNDRPVVTVPQTALVYNDAGTFVYRVVDGVAHLSPVTTGQRFKDRVAIESGLKVGEQIVSEGKVKLMDGMRVQQTTIAN